MSMNMLSKELESHRSAVLSRIGEALLKAQRYTLSQWHNEYNNITGQEVSFKEFMQRVLESDLLRWNEDLLSYYPGEGCEDYFNSETITETNGFPLVKITINGLGIVFATARLIAD